MNENLDWMRRQRMIQEDHGNIPFHFDGHAVVRHGEQIEVAECRVEAAHDERPVRIQAVQEWPRCRCPCRHTP